MRTTANDRSDRSASFIGRVAELERLCAALAQTAAGSGRVVMLLGEAGIGKTRTAAELATQARGTGALVLRGACYEGEWAPPYGPFAEALTTHVRATDTAALRDQLGFGAAPLTRLLPAIRERLPDVAEPVALQPDEERFRLLDAVSQFLIAIAKTRAVLLWLDDLHWADKGTIALLRHVARFASGHRLLLVGAYRDVEIDSAHPLAELLGALRRESTFETVSLKGLDDDETHALIAALAPCELANGVHLDIQRHTQGNPFFIRETVQHLLEEGRFADAGATMPELPVAAGIRHVVERRLSRLSLDAQRLLTVAAACDGPFRYDVAAAVAEVVPDAALQAIDEALRAKLMVPTPHADSYDFSHALVRQTLYSGLSPSRRVRLHRALAEAMETIYGDGATVGRAGEIARQYYLSADLPGAERGVVYCLAAADCAKYSAALEQVADALAMALALLPPGDAQRGSLLARRGLALGATKRADDAVAVAIEAAESIAASDGRAAAANYLAQAANLILGAGTAQAAWAVARRGLAFAEGHRDWAWAVLRAHDLDRADAEDLEHPGITVDTPERRAIAGFSPTEQPRERTEGSRPLWLAKWDIFESRQAALEAAGPNTLIPRIFWAGEYRDALPLAARLSDSALERGELAHAATYRAWCSRLRAALGDLAGAENDLLRVTELTKRAAFPPFVVGTRGRALFDVAYCRGTGLDLRASAAAAFLARNDPGMRYLRAATHALAALLFAISGRDQNALDALCLALPAVERAGGGVFTYTGLICHCCQAIWSIDRPDYADVLERNLREKTLAGDFREPGVDARLAMGQLCALAKRPDEAQSWFARARSVLDEQGARPLRAIVDYDEALMYARRGENGDLERARPLLEAALEQFRAIGMAGWSRRAEHLLATGEEWSSASQREAPTPPFSPGALPFTAEPTSLCVVRNEGDVWSISFTANPSSAKDAHESSVRLKRSKGLQYLWYLVSHPGEEFLAFDLVARTRSGGESSTAEASVRDTPLTILDASSKAAYRQRLVELRETLEEAEGANDSGSAEGARAEIQFIEDELVAAIGLGGRDRTSGSNAERARSTVTKGIKAAIAKISAAHPSLGRHLERTVRTGVFCAYEPADDERLTWQL